MPSTDHARVRLTAAAFLLLIGAAACTTQDAGLEGPDAARAFFQGKTMTYIVATEPGGSYDTYGRLISRHLIARLGLERVIVQNIEGAGQIRGANEVAAARPNGLTLGTFTPGLIASQLIGRSGLQFQLETLSWVGKAGSEPRVFIVSKASGLRSIEDVRALKRPLLMGTGGYGTEGYLDAALLAYALDHQVRFVFGLQTRTGQLSMMRGETEGQVGSFSANRDFVENGFGSIILRIGDADGLEPTIPDAADLATTPEKRAIVELLLSLSTLVRWTAGPPGIPAERLEVLRDAYMSTLQDPQFQAEAAKLRLPIAPMHGATLAKEIVRMLAQPASMVALLRSITKGADQ
jgi:tripartite-type tricarboxylate transporter receptor subunit TctC